MLPYGVSHPDRGSLDALLGFCLVFAGIALFIGSGYNKKVILHADAIEVKGWFRSRKLSFVDIRGRQTNASSRSKYGYAYIFVPTDDRKRKLAIPAACSTRISSFEIGSKAFPKSHAIRAFATTTQKSNAALAQVSKSRAGKCLGRFPVDDNPVYRDLSISRH